MTVRFFIACLEDFFELFSDYETFSICFVCSFIRPKFLQDYLNLPHDCLVILCYLGFFAYEFNLPQLLRIYHYVDASLPYNFVSLWRFFCRSSTHVYFPYFEFRWF